MKKIIIVLMMPWLIISCASKSEINPLNGSGPISMWSVTCDNLNLTRDCKGVTHKVALAGISFGTASNSDGKLVAIEIDEQDCSSVDPKDHCVTIINKRNLSILKQYYATKGITILTARPLVAMDLVFGYLLKLDKDGYSLFDELTVSGK